ncbi:MAG TPA: type VI secretion system contractile sheath large subunit [Phycisphaerae bacterium]|nr:type VI secretion system contractile sheath large subunit [Phycisphaerae bacterium]
MTDENDILDLDVDIPSPKGLKVTTDKPYRILVVADFAGTEKGTVSGPLTDRIVEIDKTTFDDVMRQAAPSVSFTFADPLASGSVLAEATVKVSSIRDFDPAAVAAQVGATARLMKVREKLVDRLLGKASAADVTKAAEAAAAGDAKLAWLKDSLKSAPAAKPADPGAVDRLMSQLDLGDDQSAGSAAPPPKSAIGSVVAGAAGGAGVPAEESAAVRRTLNEIDRVAAAWLNTVLHSTEVQSLESIWRSIAFLVTNIDFRKGVRLSLLHAHRGEMSARFISLLIDPVFDAGADAPDLIVVASTFGAAAPDWELLDELAQHAASIPAVTLVPAGPGFFGVKHAWQVPTLPALGNMFDQWQFAKFKTLRDQPYARMLGIVFGRCLLREPHAKTDAKNLEFAFKEDGTVDSAFLWAEGVFVGAITVARSVAETGWPAGISGYARGRVEGFTSAMGGKDGQKKIGPSDTQMIQSKIEEFAAVGVNCVVALKDQEDVLFWNGLSAGRPFKPEVNDLLEVSLPYQLFATRLSSLLFDLKPHLAGKGEAEIERTVRTHVQNWLQIDDSQAMVAINVQTRAAEGDPSAIELALTATPPATILPSGIPVVMGYKIPR